MIYVFCLLSLFISKALIYELMAQLDNLEKIAKAASLPRTVSGNEDVNQNV